METPELSQLHRATNILSKALSKDPDKKHLLEELETVEHTTRRLHDTLRAIVASGSLSSPPSDVLESLRSLGIIQLDEHTSSHTQALISLAGDLEHPQKPIPFFDKYSSVLPTVVAHDLIATQLAAHLLLWKAGLLSTADVHAIIDKYIEASPTVSLS